MVNWKTNTLCRGHGDRCVQEDRHRRSSCRRRIGMSTQCPPFDYGWDDWFVVRVLTIAIAGSLVAENLQAGLNITRADFSSSRLRIEGSGAVSGAVMTLDGEAVAHARRAETFCIELRNSTPMASDVIVSDDVCPTLLSLSHVVRTAARVNCDSGGWDYAAENRSFTTFKIT